MEPANALSVVGGVSGILAAVAAIIFGLVKWLGSRAVQHEDDANRARDTRLTNLEQIQATMSATFVRVDERLSTMNREQGRYESELARIAGRVDGLQADWRMRFEKLQDELRQRDEKTLELLERLRSANAEGLDNLRGIFEQYRSTIHEKFNEVTRIIISSNAELNEAHRVLRENAKKHGG